MVKARDISVTVSDKNSRFSVPVRCASMLKSGRAKHEQSEKTHSYAICSQNLDKNYIGEVEIITAGLFSEKRATTDKMCSASKEFKDTC